MPETKGFADSHISWEMVEIGSFMDDRESELERCFLGLVRNRTDIKTLSFLQVLICEMYSRFKFIRQ